ncbi:hypothetical protein CC86DRAFT_412240 [Ophiobolus disseminans]|uniref:Uncharacterized protein n=1 Tax=Ophiobolus disseminans TaxID=1469910 RepID=A0A6A6ZGX7_9PLEO|nr:hypothetical protein CC86DRAFT_412240 [Ophiobolus disseminans]
MEAASSSTQPDIAPPASSASVLSSIAFRFMDLPIEIRVLIYTELVVVGKIFYTPSGYEIQEGFRFTDREKYRKPELGIFGVSKSVREEAEEVYLSNVAFDTRSEGRLFMISASYRINDSNTNAIAGTFFNSQTVAGRKEISHRVAQTRLDVERALMWQTILEMDSIHTVELDMTNAYCPMGCCRRLALDQTHLEGVHLQQLRLVGLQHETEVSEFRQIWENDVVPVHGDKIKIELNPETDPWEQWKEDDKEEAWED